MKKLVALILILLPLSAAAQMTASEVYKNSDKGKWTALSAEQKKSTIDVLINAVNIMQQKATVDYDKAIACIDPKISDKQFLNAAASEIITLCLCEQRLEFQKGMCETAKPSKYTAMTPREMNEEWLKMPRERRLAEIKTLNISEMLKYGAGVVTKNEQTTEELEKLDICVSEKMKKNMDDNLINLLIQCKIKK